MDKILDRAANGAVVIVALLLVVAAVRSHTAPSADSSGYKVGERIVSSPPELTRGVLVVATRSTCHFCTASMPFYRTLTGARIVWLAVGEDVETNRRYLESHGIVSHRVVSDREAGLTRITATPTMILIDRDGTVVNSWVGQLQTAGQQDVTAAVRDKVID